MRRISWLSGMALLLAVSTAACVALPSATPASALMTPSPGTPGTPGETFSDPFAYCAAVGTVDTPDGRYTGPKMPPAIVDGLQKALNLTGTPAPPLTSVGPASWRCMGGKVYACTVGANLPCMDKANVDKTPTQAMAEFCQANPNSDFIPAYITGHNTIYAWQCNGGAAEAGKQVFQVDPQGFIANIWYQIKP